MIRSNKKQHAWVLKEKKTFNNKRAKPKPHDPFLFAKGTYNFAVK